MYPGYKANRPEDPEGLPEQFPMLRQVLDLTGHVAGDDARVGGRGRDRRDLRRAADPTDRIEIVSGDRDLIQLVRDPAVKLLFTLRGVSELLELDEAGVLEKYERARRPGTWSSRSCAATRATPSRACAASARRPRERWCRPTARWRRCWTTPARPSRDPGPSRASRRSEPGSPRAPTTSRRCSSSCRSTRVAPVDRWRGERDDEGLDALADELALKGPIQRMKAALDSLAEKA